MQRATVYHNRKDRLVSKISRRVSTRTYVDLSQFLSSWWTPRTTPGRITSAINGVPPHPRRDTVLTTPKTLRWRCHREPFCSISTRKACEALFGLSALPSLQWIVGQKDPRAAPLLRAVAGPGRCAPEVLGPAGRPTRRSIAATQTGRADGY